MDSEKNRLDTFKDWPLDCPVKPEDFVKAGQYCTGSGDETRCYVCNKRMSGWQSGDDPYEEHKRLYPDCKLSKEPKIPPKKARYSTQVAADRLGAQQEDLPGPSGAVASRLPSWGASPLPPSVEPSTVDPKDLDLTLLANRQKTFATWSKEGNLWSQNMALAGLYHTGPDDTVQCFECDVGLCNWDNSDVPFHEHHKISPGCQFINGILKELKNKPPKAQPPIHELPTVSHPPKYILRDPNEPGVPEQEMMPIQESQYPEAKCIICKEREREILFRPCNHLVVCIQCSTDLSRCPECNTPIVIKTIYDKRHSTVS